VQRIHEVVFQIEKEATSAFLLRESDLGRSRGI
jgi:hypothetical protein